jgi:uncharacterized protein
VARARGLSVICVPTLECNCSCAYCFSKPRGSGFDPGVWRPVFRQLLEHLREENLTELRCIWLGGEMLTIDPQQLGSLLDETRALYADHGATVQHRIQSNLIGYSSTWRPVLLDHFQAHVSSSIDYPNLYRKAPGIDPDGYIGEWMSRRQQVATDGIAVSAIALPNPETLHRGAAEFLRFFTDQAGVRKLRVNFPYPGHHPAAVPSLDLEALARFMVELYHLWRTRGRPLEITPFQELEDRILKGSRKQICIWSYDCTEDVLTIGPAGDVVQCDYWVTAEPSRTFGNLLRQPVRQIMRSEARQMLRERPIRLLRETACGECWYWPLCHGGCPIRAVTFGADLFEPDHYCPVYRKLFSAVGDFVN